MESNYDEDLNDNTFFQILQQSHFELFQKATVDGWVICVPRSGSLPKYVLSHDDFFNHILIPSDELPETHFRTLNDKDVRICNRLITVEPGSNSSPFSTHVLFEETFYTEDMLKYKILCIDSPLEQFPDKLKSHTDIIVIETLRDCIDLIWTESGSKDILERMDAVISTFLSRNQKLEFKPLQVQKDLLSNLYIQCLQLTMQDSRIREKSSQNRHFLDNIKLSVESYMHHGVYKKLIKGITACTAFEDSMFNKIVRNLSDIQLRDLDVRPDLLDTVPKARSELARVDGYSTVLGKVGCLKRTLAAISKQDLAHSKQGNVIAADDLLPMLVFLVIKSGLPNWIAHLTYMIQFNFSSSNEVLHVDQDSFLVTSLEASIEHIKSGLLIGPSSPESQLDYEEESSQTMSLVGSNGMLQEIPKYFSQNEGQGALIKLFDAARTGNEEEVNFILKEFKDKSNGVSSQSICPPFCSCEKCDSKVLVSGRIILCHPLCSCDKCESQISQKLKDTTPTIHSCDDRGYSALHIACMYGKPKIVDILLSHGSNVHATDYSGSTPLHHASSRGHQNALLLLIHSGANINTCDSEGNTPLHFASSNGHDGCVKAILYFSEHNGSDLNINKRNNHGDTSLHNASRWGYEMIVKLLLNAGADPTIENKRKLTPIDFAHNLHISRLLNSRPIPSRVKLIVPHFKVEQRQDTMKVAAASKAGLDFTDDTSRGKSPTSGEYPRTTEEIKKVEKVLRCIAQGDIRLACFYLGLEDHTSSPRKKCHPLCDCKHSVTHDELGASTPNDALQVNICNVDGLTPLHIAVQNGHSELVEILLDSGAIANIQTKKNITPLHLACLHQRTLMVQMLLEAHCDINCQDMDGNTPLHYSCQVNNARLVKLLMENNPNLNLRNSKGKTPLEEAEDKMSITVARLLSQSTGNRDLF